MAQFTKNPQDEENVKPQIPDYNDEEQAYLGYLKTRIRDAKDKREERHAEFDNQTFLEYTESNRKLMNTHVEPKKSKSDNNYTKGTVRQKAFSYLSALNNLDLFADLQVFDETNHELQALGQGMEDIMFVTAETEDNDDVGDDESKLLRQYTNLEQGTVFVEDMWQVKWKKYKTIKKEFKGDPRDVEVVSELKKSFEGFERNILPNENVILGDIRQYYMNKQPFIAPVLILPYEEAEARYGTLDRWKFVPKKMTTWLLDDTEKKYAPFHLFDTTDKNLVEVVLYQDIYNNEFMILANGVMLTPIRYPMPWKHGRYSVVKNVLEPISPFFAYGKSLPAKTKHPALLLDEMTRLILKKTQKSLYPPMVNNANRPITARALDPGRITSNIPTGSLSLLDPNTRAVEGAEFSVLELLQSTIDESTVDKTFAGQQPSGSPTATQIMEVQKQAKMMIGLTVFMFSLLERKLAWLRLFGILENWMKATGRMINPYTGEFITQYREISRKTNIEGAGKGRRIVRLRDEIPSSREIMAEEDALSEMENQPVRITYLSPKEILQSKYLWYITVTPREKKTNALNKVLFSELMNQLSLYFPDMTNREFLKQRFAENWEMDPAKLFGSPEQPAENPFPVEGENGQPTPQPGSPNVKQAGMNQMLSNSNMMTQ